MATITDRISKEQFLVAYNNHPANAWDKFTFKYFSASALPKDKWLKKGAVTLLLSSFAVGFLGTVLNVAKGFIAAALIPYLIVLLTIAILMFATFFMNNARIRKIMKELNVNKDEYDALVSVYLS
jgi:hypothetical protein